MSLLFNEILYRPLLNLLIAIYNNLPGQDFGLAIVLLTFLIKIVFFPLTLKTARSQKALAELNPEISAIKEKYKNDKSSQSAAIMALYKDKKINPLAGCLPLLIQLPILVALYRVFLDGVKPENLNMLYAFVHNPGELNKIFLGLVEITAKSPWLAFLAGGLQMIQAKVSAKNMPVGGNKELSALSSQMLYFFPVMIIIIGWNLPAGVMLYWVASTLFSIGEQWFVKRNGPK
ncbi:MAG: hypothetical protein A2750_01580 [Candidatus Yanofskybacteria bacterium RIFCSPHIGHO2_01_FULL_45_42]|uniref:Membrane insertase YidC/Oxa/ALB C-terminal domain-containing protein n=2 Tax=Candidatus Yanofskyibacteriota TaxID=1752733 RepID=A0A1F8F695_9BACT|nr:MAG: hypothetical protein A2750_01580 [Candidatus Yanofskybacteria bacterium RIFCSPHIGHO2_01_FULL_45_42]OGN26637.1 MAG: hypothetical protein A3B17_00535 [Candidatus Yanofskybacteria bacterium RIFCSPLOWO2_01_FULL_45_72]OGN31980.1 MAG: hypothetical protein A3J01_02800 [Candidatus Yanofskybacteria bacterium RIFCSPLOWO2_02_FULL_45_18]